MSLNYKGQFSLSSCIFTQDVVGLLTICTFSNIKHSILNSQL